MRRFIVYDVADGTILRYGSCQNKDVALQAKINEKAKEVPELILGFDIDYRIKLGPTPNGDEVVKKELVEESL